MRKGGGCFDDGGGGDGGCFELRAADDATPRWTTRRSFAPARRREVLLWISSQKVSAEISSVSQSTNPV